MVQYDHQDGKKVEGKWLARYEGEWKDGKFHGKGLYETADGLKYTGQFANNLRDGDGIEEISDELALKIGYSKYEAAAHLESP
ncbi:unnamed protein product [Effrenium voratum]|uniref:MORN repeat-containing protein n=1 Tax=Effrenium voratum TaxID=2562239 RepID=A0AA36JNR0_9DINO|nr:unnamed protein product [Effrenium voratum]